MKSPLVYAGNMIRKVFLKIRYGSKLHMGNIQSFQHIGMEIRNGGKISIGRYCQNRGKVWLICDGGKLSIGDHCFFNINSSITCVENITIGDNCKFGNNLVIVDHDHNYKRKDESEPEFVGSPITIGDNTWIGADVVILRGTKIGNNCVIGAGSVVKGEISNDSVVIQKKQKDVYARESTDMNSISGEKSNWQNVLAAISIIVLILSILPLLKVSFYDRATGDDYGYGAVTRQALLQTYSPLEMVSAAAKQVKDFWYSYQGTWFSVFLFAFQPEVFSLKAYWITAWIALALTISSVSVFLHTILVSVMGWPREEFITVDCCTLFIMLQFVYSPRSAIFWFNGMAHYVVPLALALFSMSCFIKYIQNKKIRYVVISSIMMALLGGMSYLSAFMAPLFLILLWIMNHKKGRYIWRLAVPFGLECIGLVISVVAPGNANRGGSGYSVSLGRAVGAVGKSVLQGTTAVSDFFIQKPLVFLIMSVMILAAWSAARRSERKFEYQSPVLVIVWLYLIYCAMYWPGIFADVDVSGGVPNTIFQVFIIMFALSAAYLTGYFVKGVKIGSSLVLKIVWICVFVVLCGFTFVNKGTIKNATSYITIEYLKSGQADDYKKQMDEFTSVMTDPSVINAKVHASNNEQGPLMHMPITNNPDKFTNYAAARFFGKNSVIAIDE